MVSLESYPLTYSSPHADRSPSKRQGAGPRRVGEVQHELERRGARCRWPCPTGRRQGCRTLNSDKQLSPPTPSPSSSCGLSQSGRGERGCERECAHAGGHGVPLQAPPQRDRAVPYDHVSRQAMLEGLRSRPALVPLLPFARQCYGSASVAQGEGGEQGDPLMPALFSLAQLAALSEAAAGLLPFWTTRTSCRHGDAPGNGTGPWKTRCGAMRAFACTKARFAYGMRQVRNPAALPASSRLARTRSGQALGPCPLTSPGHTVGECSFRAP